nr:MAG TPA: anaerobic ribonucleoside-triphosphate reductase activating protein [Caudoviricetes sp.]
MNYSHPFVTVQDVPDEIALAISISGCPLRCKGCHSAFTRDPNYGSELNYESLIKLLNKHKLISCVCFYGGEWNSELIEMIKIVKSYNLKVCLYTGLEIYQVPDEIIKQLDYIKVGPYIESLGPLGSPNTNQKFIKLKKELD